MLSVVAIVYQQHVVLIVLCGVAVVAIVVEQDTAVIVHCHVYNVNGIISNLDRFCQNIEE